MTSMLNQNVIAYPGPADREERSFLHARQREELPVNPAQRQTDNDGDRMKPFVHRIIHFDLNAEDWGSGATAVMYRCYLSALQLKSRELLYSRILENVVKGNVPTTSLLAFAIFEPHMKIVCKAVQDYLTHRNCDIEDEFAGVHEIVGVLANKHTANKGAVLAGLVAIGDRRVNAVARAARHLLSEADIKDFSRVQHIHMRSSSVEFYLDWLLELNQKFSREAVSDLACALMLMVVHDEFGEVEDVSEVNYVGFKMTTIRQTQPFESYYSEILPILKYLRQCDQFEPAISMVIEMWDGHKSKAAFLRNR